MKTLKCDLCIIGAGSGGLSVAAGAAQMGADVVLVEKHKMGGDCLNYGCVPSKSLLAAAKTVHTMKTADRFGIHCKGIDIDFQKIHQHVHDVIATIAPNDSVERFEGFGVKVIQQTGRFINPKTLCTDDHHIEARYFIIATGSSPTIPAITGLDDIFFLTNETIFDLDSKPEHLIILGGGPIGCEMAQAHRLLGSQVTQIVRSEILPKDDRSLVSVIRDRLLSDGVQLFEQTQIDNVESNEKGITVEFTQNDNTHSITGSHLLVATGRTPNIEQLDLDNAGVRYSDRAIFVNNRLRTSNKRIYAIGDVIGLHQFTHMANYHAGIVIKNTLFKIPAKINLQQTPWVTYTDPELAHVGLHETEAFELDQQINVLEWPFTDNDRAQAERNTNGKIKVITRKNGQILGASIVGPHAGELLMPWSLAIKQKLKIGALADIIAPYPTLSEVNKRVAGSYYTPLLFSKRTRRLVQWLKRI